MPEIRLQNLTRGPLILELPSLGLVQQTVALVTAAGRQDVPRAFPRSVTLLARASSDPLPESVRNDPQVAAALAAKPPQIRAVSVPGKDS